MGECLIVRRGGESYELPTLDASYPKDATVTAAANGSASFSISITTPGRPAEYTYQWYRNGAAVSGGTAASLTLTGLTAVATYSVYCKVTNKAGSVNSRTAILTVRSYLPTYTYTGTHQLIDEGNFNWRLKLFTSGTLTFSYLGNAGTQGAQVFLVGGGGGAGGFGAGGGGGYTRTGTVALATGTGYPIIVGAGGAAGGNAGGDSSALGLTVSGGRGGGYNFAAGGDGGSGGGGRPYGPGGTDGGNGGTGTVGDARGPGGSGQGSTTREFGLPTGTLYSSGGWGMDAAHTQDEAANTGNGGDSNGDNGKAGGSGIVVIRNKR